MEFLSSGEIIEELFATIIGTAFAMTFYSATRARRHSVHIKQNVLVLRKYFHSWNRSSFTLTRASTMLLL